MEIRYEQLPIRSPLRPALKALTNVARKVLDGNGQPIKKKFWFGGMRKRTHDFFLKEPFKDYGINFDVKSREITLNPINPRIISDQYLIHRGRIRRKYFSNIENIRVLKIFGDPGTMSPTYMSPITSIAAPYNRILGRPNVTLLVEKNSLIQLTHIYMDPEMVYRPMTTDRLDSAFIVFGGIPREAITGFSFNVNGGPTEFILRRGKRMTLKLKVPKFNVF